MLLSFSCGGVVHGGQKSITDILKSDRVQKKQNKMLSLCAGLSKPCFAGSLLLAVAIGN